MSKAKKNRPNVGRAGPRLERWKTFRLAARASIAKRAKLERRK